MTAINLKDYYPDLYTSDYVIEVPDEITGFFNADEKREAAYERRRYHYKAQYSLNRDDGIENAILHKETSAEDAFDRESTTTHVLTIMETLPEKQARRIYALYFLGVDRPTLARVEGITKRALNLSIQRGLRRIRKDLKKFF
ncbi:MAG: sigma-70 family RNA polymerase sigma factor [Ethanoligenens sp.]|uniref:sigma-70 family RNA polymerase sigma factor n=1 Tax=Ethanoligenens sp. TaxID=2099655 RepID=UPI0039EC89B4